MANRIRTSVPEAILADVITELNDLGVLIDDLTRADGTCTISARMEEGELSKFERWLAVFTKGIGRIEVQAD